jgi:hypothetical protein
LAEKEKNKKRSCEILVKIGECHKRWEIISSVCVFEVSNSSRNLRVFTGEKLILYYNLQSQLESKLRELPPNCSGSSNRIKWLKLSRRNLSQTRWIFLTSRRFWEALNLPQCGRPVFQWFKKFPQNDSHENNFCGS